MKRTQVITIIAIVVLLIAVLAGWYVWQSDQQATQSRQQQQEYLLSAESDLSDRHDAIAERVMDDESTSAYHNQTLRLIDEQLASIDRLEDEMPTVQTPLFGARDGGAQPPYDDIRSSYRDLRTRIELYRDSGIANETYEASAQQTDDYNRTIDTLTELTKKLSEQSFAGEAETQMAEAYVQLRDAGRAADAATSEAEHNAAMERVESTYDRITGELDDALKESERRQLEAIKAHIDRVAG